MNLFLLTLKGLRLLSGFEKCVFQKHKASLQSPSNEKDLLRVLFTLKLQLFLLLLKVFFFYNLLMVLRCT